jgi:hypothetical protein
MPKAGLVDGEIGLVSAQLFQSVGTQLIAHQTDILDGRGEQTLHAIGSGSSSMLSQLPAIFARSLTQDALDVSQGPTTRFCSGKMRSDACMQTSQFVWPSHHIGYRYLGCLWYGRGVMLHSLLLVDRHRCVLNCLHSMSQREKEENGLF